MGLDVLDAAIDLSAHLHDVGIARGSHQDADGPLAVAVEGIACGFFVPLFDTGNVAQSELVVIMPLDKHLADVIYRLQFVGDMEADALVSVVEVAAVGGLVLPVERSEHFSRFHAEVGHAVLQQGDVDALGPFAVEVHALHALDVAHLALYQFGIVGELALTQSIACQGIKHAEYIAEVILYHRS